MSTMIQQVLRWQESGPSGHSSDRWSEWAQSLAGRHRQISLRHGAAIMTLLRPFTTLYLLCQRRQSQEWRFFPHIKLAIAPILRESIWREIAVQNNPGKYTVLQERGDQAGREQWPHSVAIQGGHEAQTHSRSFGIQAMFLNQHTAVHHRDVLSAGQIAPASEPLDQASIASSRRSPLRKVFERMEEIESVTRLHRQLLLSQQSLQIPRRVVQQGMRVEERNHSITVVRDFQYLQHHTMPRATDVEPTAHESMTGTNSRKWPQAPTPPAVNIEHLTEQVVQRIDRRLIAWRERTGRVF